MDLLTQPRKQGRQLTARHRLVNHGIGLTGGLHQLGRRHRAQCIAREIAKQTIVPVNILQHAMRIIGRGDAEQIMQSLVPLFGQIADL